MTYWITPLKKATASDWRLSEGSSVRLSCHADADPLFELQYLWFKRVSWETFIIHYRTTLARILRFASKRKCLQFKRKKAMFYQLSPLASIDNDICKSTSW